MYAILLMFDNYYIVQNFKKLDFHPVAIKTGEIFDAFSVFSNWSASCWNFSNCSSIIISPKNFKGIFNKEINKLNGSKSKRSC